MKKEGHAQQKCNCVESDFDLKSSQMSKASILTSTNSSRPSHPSRTVTLLGDIAAVTAADTVPDLHRIPY